MSGKFTPPFIVIPMPLNKDGDGPAGSHETVKVVWQVWDAANCTVSSHDTEVEALNAQTKLNVVHGDEPFFDGTYLVEQDGKLIRKRTEPVCDFCCQKIKGSCWTYPCGFVELPLLDDPTGLPGVSDDPWCCCNTCKPLVDEKDWMALAGRTVWEQAKIAGIEISLDHPNYPVALAAMMAHFERFDAARNGEPYEEKADA